jgi:Tfp pilus assembly protein PilF
MHNNYKSKSYKPSMQAQRIIFLKAEIEKEPEEPFNYYGLAMEYLDNEPLKAEKLLENLLENFQDYLPTYYKAANLYFDLGKFVAAKNTFEKGILLAEKQNNEKAIRELKGSYQQFLDETDD